MINRFLNNEEIKTIYPKLFEKIFGYWDSRQIPSVVVVREEDKICAFLSGYWHDINTFYIQYSGILPEYQNKNNSIIYFKDGLRFLVKNLGAKAYTAIVPNNYIHVMKILLSCKFIPYGMRHATDSTLYVEWLRVEENNG